MSPYHRFLFAFVIKNLLLRQERRDAASYLVLTLMELLDREMPINLSELVVTFVTMAMINVKQNHAIPYGSHPEDGKGRSSIVASTSGPADDGEMQKLYQEIDHLLEENKQLKAQLVKNEETAEAHRNDLMSLDSELSPLTVSSPSISSQSPPVAPNVYPCRVGHKDKSTTSNQQSLDELVRLRKLLATRSRSQLGVNKLFG
ncbi:hypothetical protein HAX54_027351 [Datura stramonium]|uniref:Uncharacterized protein n=1 Tax=Datura stramonium TaxID=4076 RepID=A0ABS8V4Z1_DATST|nr:hypothetical protein [Datura stramonium]